MARSAAQPRTTRSQSQCKMESSPILAPSIVTNARMQRNIISLKMDIDLTEVLAQASRKRLREPDQEAMDEPISKRLQTIATPTRKPNLPFPFNTQQQRSAITSATTGERRNGLSRYRQNAYASPSRKFADHSRDSPYSRKPNSNYESFEGFPEMHPTSMVSDTDSNYERGGREHNADLRLSRSGSSNLAQVTPSTASASNTWLGSVRKFFGFGSTSTTADETPPTQTITNGAAVDRVELELRAHVDDEVLSQNSENESPALKIQLRRSQEISPSRRQNQRQPMHTPVHSRGSSWSQRHGPGPEDSSLPLQEKPANIISPDPSTTKKRKLTSVDGEIPGPRRGGFGIDESYLDVDNEVEGIDESAIMNGSQFETPVAKRQKFVTQSPLKSAMKSGTRSGMSVGFASNLSTSRAVYGVHGRAGDYKGSTFSEGHSFASDSSASFDGRSILSPGTVNNTFENQERVKDVRAQVQESPGSDSSNTSIFQLDPTVRDPNDENWLPTSSNPRPGSFRVPDYFEVDLDEMTPEMLEIPPLPKAPRMSHVQLPSAAPQPDDPKHDVQSEDTSSQSTELKLNKARSEAQKYKPKDSSRLSLVEQARSRSSSPPSSVVEETVLQRAGSRNAALRKTRNDSVPLEDSLTSAQPAILDNQIRGPDGMTAYEREHQYDGWASNLDWPQYQTYSESGVGSEYITKLVADRWTEEDSRRSQEFWQKEFDSVDKAMNQAKAQGLTLELITGE